MLLLVGAQTLTACSSRDAEAGERIACATRGGAFAAQCTLETVVDRGDMLLIVGSPELGYRRLRRVDDGRGVVSADGAHEAHVFLRSDGMADVTVADERYLLPARRP